MLSSLVDLVDVIFDSRHAFNHSLVPNIIRTHWKVHLHLLLFIAKEKILMFPYFFFRGFYFMEGSIVKMDMKVEHAYRRSIETVIRWVNTQLNSSKTQVFFPTYSPVHFRFVFIP